MDPFRYSIWLVPCAEQREALQRTINGLSARFGTPPFMPHATLCSGVWNKSEAELFAAVEKVGRSLRESRLSMKVDGIDWTDHWATFFFVRLTGADDLFSRAAERVEGSHPPEIGPHLSLMYSFGDKQIDRDALCAELEGSLPDVIRFDSLVLVRPATGRWEDVERWETVRTIL
jgi:hypothetical protein